MNKFEKEIRNGFLQFKSSQSGEKRDIIEQIKINSRELRNKIKT